MKQQIINLINRFWEGKLSKNEQQKLLSELENAPLSLMEDLKSDFGNTVKDKPMPTAAEYADILSDIHDKMGVVQKMSNRRRIAIGWSVVASVFIAITLFAYYFFVIQNPIRGERENLVQKNSIDRNLTNNSRDTLIFKMSDGSRIALSPNSKILFTTEYGNTDRKLTLVGEAKFSVAHDQEKPFIVSANGYTTTALGTEFLIDSYAENVLSVKLLSGKVVVKSTLASQFDMHDQIMKPGQKLLIDDHRKSATLIDRENDVNKNKKIVNKTSVKVNVVEPTIEFEQTPLPEVFAKIERIKGIVINIDDALLTGLSFTGRFEKHYTVETMLSIICQMNDLNYSYHDEYIVVVNK